MEDDVASCWWIDDRSMLDIASLLSCSGVPPIPKGAVEASSTHSFLVSTRPIERRLWPRRTHERRHCGCQHAVPTNVAPPGILPVPYHGSLHFQVFRILDMLSIASVALTPAIDRLIADYSAVSSHLILDIRVDGWQRTRRRTTTC